MLEGREGGRAQSEKHSVLETKMCTADRGRNEHGVYVSSYHPRERERERGAEKSIATTLLIRQQHQGLADLRAIFGSRFREFAVGGQQFSFVLLW